MVTYAQLRDLDTSALSEAAAASGELAEEIAGHAEDVRHAGEPVPAQWDGADAAVAGEAIAAPARPLEQASDAFYSGRGHVYDLVDKLEEAHEDLQTALDSAAGTPILVDDSGTVTVAEPTTLTPDRAVEYFERWNPVALEIQGQIDTAVEAADSADAEAVEVLNAVNTEPGRIPNGPGDTPEDVAAWWDGLDDGERERYEELFPHMIAELDGIPTDVRDRANRAVLDADVDALERELEDDNLADGRRDNLEHELEMLLGLQEQLDDHAEKTDMPVRLLGFDGATEYGRAIVAVGDVEEADDVLTHVGGAFSGISGLDGQLDRMQTVLDSSGDGAAGVMWLDYSAPPVWEAGDPQPAEEAAERFNRFQDGIEQVNSNAHTTVLGHSYGATVLGQAAAAGGGLNADTAILVGAPTYIGVPDADGLGVEQVYLADGHGEYTGALPADSPHGDPDFGGEDYDSGNFTGHSSYWDRDTFVENTARIVAGEEPKPPPEWWEIWK